MAEARHRAVARYEAHIVAERKELLADRRDQRTMVAARKIAAPDRALEQHIADKGEAGGRIVEHDVPGRVAGTVQHVETDRTDLDAVAVLEPAVRRERLRRRKTEQLGLLGQAVEPERLVALRADDRYTEPVAQFERGADVIQMAVGQEHARERELAPRDLVEQALGVAARIDQRGDAVGVPNQRAVLLIRRHGEDGKFHGIDYPPIRIAMSASTSGDVPDALLLLSTHCPHCPAVLAALAELVKQGVIGRLEAVNLERHPEVGQALGVRSVPWIRIGGVELSGVHSKAELAAWAAKADSEAGVADWFHQLLKEGQLPRAQAAIEADPALLAAVLPIVGNVDASLNVRLGAGALLEQFAGSAALRALLPRLGELSQHPDARVRADACHYLGLTADAAAKPWLEARAKDDDADVREIAADSLQALGRESM